jgi:hypothetical protein
MRWPVQFGVLVALGARDAGVFQDPWVRGTGGEGLGEV